MSEQQVLVSVIMPVYNAEKYLLQAVRSVQAQSWKNWELILVDDGSTDGSGALCDRFAAEDARIRAFHKKNGGASSARNMGLDAMRGELVTFIDSDDFFAPELIEYLYGVMERTGADIAEGQPVETAEREITQVTVPEEQIELFPTGRSLLEQRAVWRTCGVPMKLYRRALFDAVRFTEGMIYEDNAIAVPLLWDCGAVAISNRPIYYYYLSPDSVMRSAFSIKRFDYLKTYELRHQFFLEHGAAEMDRRNNAEYYLQIACFRWQMKLSRWPEGPSHLAELRAKERALRPLVRKNPYYTFIMRGKRFFYRFLPHITTWLYPLRRHIPGTPIYY